MRTSTTILGLGAALLIPLAACSSTAASPSSAPMGSSSSMPMSSPSMTPSMSPSMMAQFGPACASVPAAAPVRSRGWRRIRWPPPPATTRRCPPWSAR